MQKLTKNSKLNGFIYFYIKLYILEQEVGGSNPLTAIVKSISIDILYREGFCILACMVFCEIGKNKNSDNFSGLRLKMIGIYFDTVLNCNRIFCISQLINYLFL